MASDDLLDNFCWAALTGPQRRFGEFLGRAARFQPELLPVAAMDDNSDSAAWRDLAVLAGGRQTLVVARNVVAPHDWTTVREVPIRQMVDDGAEAAPDPEARILGPDDVPAMMNLLSVSPPGGPFLKRTPELGTFLGLWRDDRLIAMAGERIRVDGWTEISAVVTDPQYRGRGYASRLVRALSAEIHARGDRVFLHIGNEGLVKLYERLGFAVRAEITMGMYVRQV
nr:GNAT family N-acetyltransferase [uncultured Actinoplanes sp.]